MPSILDSYLVSVGFQTDLASLRNLQGVLNQAQSSVSGSFGKIGATVLGVQTAIVGAFSAIGAAVIGFGVQVANQDQAIRLYSNRMLMTYESAWKLQKTLQILGVTLQELQTDRELQERALSINVWLDDMLKLGSPEIQGSLRNIRELQDQFKTFSVALVEIGEKVLVNSLFKKLGFDVGDLRDKFGEFVRLAVQHIPEIADQISGGLIPVLHTAWSVIKNWGQALLAVGDGFSDLINALAQDKTIDQETTRWNKWGRAIGNVADLLATVANAISTLVALTGHGAAAAVAVGKTYFNAYGSIAENRKESQLDLKVAKAARDLTLGPYASSLTDEDLEKAADGGGKSTAEIIEAAKTIAKNRGANENGVATFGAILGSGMTKLKSALEGSDIDKIAYAVEGIESSHHMRDEFGGVLRGRENYTGERAIGLMQLLPSTAAKLGVDPYNEAENRAGGKKLLQQLFQKYGNWTDSLEAYNWGEKFVDEARAGKRSVPYDVQNYAARALSGAGVTVNVIVNGRATAREVAEDVYTHLSGSGMFLDYLHTSAQSGSAQ